MRLEQDLAAARRDVEIQTALAAKASEEASRLKQASESGAAEQQKSLQQERERSVGLEQDLAAARRDVETQTALAAKASEEASRLKQASESSAAEQQQVPATGARAVRAAGAGSCGGAARCRGPDGAGGESKRGSFPAETGKREQRGGAAEVPATGRASGPCGWSRILRRRGATSRSKRH